MEAWKLVLLILPAGLLLGTLGGQATRPVPLMKEERPWPAPLREKIAVGQPSHSIYETGTQALDSGRYSYRPSLDYRVFVWPDQRDYSADILAEDYSYGVPLEADYALAEPELPQTRRAEAELAAEQAGTALAETSEATTAAQAMPSRNGGVIVLPPVPPRLDVIDVSAGVPASEEPQ